MEVGPFLEPEIVLSQLRESIVGIKIAPEAEQFLHDLYSDTTDGITCWRDEKTERGPSVIKGLGLCARADVAVNTLVAIKPGRQLNEADVRELSAILRGAHQQVAIDTFLGGQTPDEVDRNLVGYNHSCDPNSRVLVLLGVPLAFIVTTQDVLKGDELTVFYPLSYTTDTQHLEPCQCSSVNCQKIIAPEIDWKDPDVQERFVGQFAFYIQEKIDKLD